MKTVSIVVPVYNEEDNLREFHKRITEVMEKEPYDYKIVFVNDGSSDNSAVILSELAKEDAHVEAYLLSRNFGHCINQLVISSRSQIFKETCIFSCNTFSNNNLITRFP